MAEIGRPTKYNDELGEEICSVIACSTKGTKRLCDEIDYFPDQKTLFVWLRKHEKFRQHYVKAKQDQAEVLVDAMLCVIDREEDVQRARLKVDTYKWIACKLVPKLYGDRKEEKTETESLLEKIIDKL